MGTLSGWSYYKDITITGQSGAGIDYQIELDIGDSAGGDFHLEGHCTNFPQDIRITDNDGTTLLDYWVEDITADPIIVHVEVKDDLGSNQTIRVYYGKSGESSASNGANTFLQYHGAATDNFIDSLVVDPTNNYAFETIARITASYHNIEVGLGTVIPWAGDKAFIQSYDPNGTFNRRYLQTLNNSNATQVFETPKFETNHWYRGLLTFDGTTVRGYWDSNEIGSGSTTNLPDQLMGLFLNDVKGGSQILWSFARKYNSPEPAFSSAGAEQSIGVGWSDKIIGISSPSKVNGIAAADISKIIGVA